MSKSIKGLLAGFLFFFILYLYIFAFPVGKIQSKDLIWGFFFSFSGSIVGYMIGRGFENKR